MNITTLETNDHEARTAAAMLLVEGFRDFAPQTWPDLQSAQTEVEEALDPAKICRVAYDEAGLLVGWIGSLELYPGHVWELHPLVVRRSHQRQGVGRALVQDLERQVVARGGSTIFLGTDDEAGLTSLAGVDLYPDVSAHMSTIRNVRDHPYAFYQRCGFVIVGLVPDANGFGKPDILMAKRVAQASGPK
ncbi:GNAT family N-acetyltransferase [Candidatus Chloroploca sp. M-50]|uniref:GNAT family N-acetyltransferase n=1 Tax=Candidatus Chloroploca mongolica TaxID=2528176 RepID=A0ABS4DAT8_9CHLR|nr:GNAT family N-acetyltransferase [Candidatus Chloroploca mongolica]MBP1466576.1 GNAT family N-acetyltransferase [Candidatus Chloroploca mongolica]